MQSKKASAKWLILKAVQKESNVAHEQTEQNSSLTNIMGTYPCYLLAKFT